MTHDDRTSRTDQPALPDDLGNELSERSGYYDESESGMSNTPTFPGNPASPLDVPGSDAITDTGTTFGTGGDDKGM
ncbi:hypothetical protein F8S09_11070 [Deinococcus sp. SDU3-2]|uniref:Uncharacterized protein n=1 Tax=Deinococcus terrestris TaxID=2651870 RepID=A0A7X1TSC0_9DEIO|nr:hypothetical protein [Deinococcus terrestris]MPY67227.1 hypothetical protein [Deinococcus terrestris]